MNQKRMLATKQLVFLSILVAITVLLDIYAIKTPVSKTSFKFLPISLSAMLFGPFATGIMAAVADIIGTFFLSTGNLHLGFTFSQFLTGLVYGFFYYNKPNKYKYIIIANVIILVLVTLVLNNIWLYQIMGEKFTYSTIIFRFIKEVFFIPIKVIVTFQINLLVFSRIKYSLQSNKTQTGLIANNSAKK